MELYHEKTSRPLNYFEQKNARPCHFLQGDMNLAVPGDPIFGIGQIPYESKKVVQSIPNIWVTVKGGETDQHIAFQKKA